MFLPPGLPTETRLAPTGQTLLHDDGILPQAALALEDWHYQPAASILNSYDVSGLRVFDTTHLDRTGTAWRFDEPDFTDWAQAQCMTTGFAGG